MLDEDCEPSVNLSLKFDVEQTWPISATALWPKQDSERRKRQLHNCEGFSFELWAVRKIMEEKHLVNVYISEVLRISTCAVTCH